MKRIVLYRCRNCGGAAKIAPGAGVKEIVLSCGGQLEAIHVLRAFEDGAAGVMAVHCDPEKCRTLDGSARAIRRLNYARRLLEESGVEGERLKTVVGEKELDLEEELKDFLRKLAGPQKRKNR
jgi:F420-non-reducing hydrogenase iron-sulfur subunit